MFQGHEVFRNSNQVSDGLSVSLYQDAVEMLLRAVAAHVDASIESKTSFDGIFEKIKLAEKNQEKKEVPMKISITDLNKSRVNFKHYGLLPTHEDAKKFNRNIELFFQRVVEEFIGISYETISLSDIVSHDRIRNFIKIAEKNIADEKFLQSINNSAKALHLILLRIKPEFSIFRCTFPTDIESKKMRDYLSDRERVMKNHDDQLNFLRFGISLEDYSYFMKFAPAIQYTYPDNAFRVVNRVVNLQRREFSVINEDAELIVYPDNIKELIKKYEIGEIIVGDDERFDKEDYYSIIHQNDRAYILKNAVKPNAGE
jgi:hypothetical protein